MKTRRVALALSAAAVAAGRSRRLGGSCAKHHAHAQPAYRFAGPDDQSDGGAARQSHDGRNPGQRRPSRSGPASTPQPSRERRTGRRSTSVMRTPPDRAIGVSARQAPYARYSHNLYPVCEYANRGPRRRMLRSPGDLGRRRRQRRRRPSRTTAARPQHYPAGCASICARSRNEFVAEIDGALSTAQADELARRHGLERIAVAEFSAARRHHRPVPHHRSAARSDTVRREFAADASVKSVQPNFRYVLQDQKKTPTEGDPRNMRSPSFDCRRRIRWPAA